MAQSTTPSDATPDKNSPASETSPGLKCNSQKAFGVGSRRGKKPRTESNAGLTLDDAGVDDFQSSTAEMVSLTLMRDVLAVDREMMQSERALREEQGQAAMVEAQAALLKSKAELLDRVIRCRELQVEVPAELLAALQQ